MPNAKLTKKSKVARRVKSRGFSIQNIPKVQIHNIFFVLLFIICGFCFIFSLIQIIKWCTENNTTTEQISIIRNNTDAENNVTTFMSVDLSQSQEINPETIGWLEVTGTEISYPFVQTSDNDFYLNHSFDQTWNDAGWVFLDYRNSSDLNDQNQIIYGHGRADGSMFGTLKNTLTNDWQNNPENHFVKISTPQQDSIWQIFSIYEVETTNDYLTTNFNSDEDFGAFLDLIINRSVHDFQTPISASDNILTLSTCTNTNSRAVLHAKLTKIAKK